MPAEPADAGYGAGEGLAVVDAAADPEGIADAVGTAVADPDADPEAPADPLGAAETLGTGLGLGDGKSVDGTFANERAKISTNMTSTATAHGCARLSERGGSAPR
jgi:hypothetical protein